ncbi:glycine cleavage system aminomethyltransferase GcvT [Pseudomarimonas salicorniae]|uniref:Aminomethyltransferase n=1 Tax=Pseudomarimonas salicorniae TaxID=2933270 RepID=A0ABT0GC95_9GAMM|nr:glycine cleavage system aminomethyltransferase GcvT [Lysobacter sp. CAU 1642]MCK7592159.1 glycine cleavage system aminomethyltransferase GcvT [Lysobacter sp. CAU 1642]
MTRKTILNDAHRALGAKMVDFGGWDMPIHYGSQIEEHHAVRRDAGMFDVSHMTVVDLSGARCRDFLRYLLANNVDKLKKPGRALYTCMLNTAGGVVDDLIVYFRDEDDFRLVVNAATRDKDLAWIETQAPPFGIEVRERPELAMIAVQGPRARERFAGLLDAAGREAVLALPRFAAVSCGELFVARTGYTGEDGFEITLPEQVAAEWWQRLVDAGVRPAGLGARDTLRLEAGMNLYGQDMDDRVTPFEAGLAWTVALDGERNFIGRPALEAQRAAGVPTQMIGAVMDDKGVLRHGQRVLCSTGEGEVLSGTFSPTASKSIAFVRVPAGEVADLRVDIRGREVPLRVFKPPFVREGKAAEGL